MCLRLVLLLAYVSWTKAVEPTQEHLFAQLEPAQYLFSSRDYQTINELALVPPPPSRLQNSYLLYYAPIEPRDSKIGYEALPVPVVPAESNQALLIQPIPYAKKAPASFPALYLKPPAPDSHSDYEKFQSHPIASVAHEVDSFPRNHQPAVTIKNKKNTKISHQNGPLYIRDHAPIQQADSDSKAALETKVNVKKKSANKESPGSLALSNDGDRIEFQIQGHEGPKTYIFGFDTGDGKNRQFRLEERLKDGTVKGHYGYYDARGKLRTIRYLARPFEGYKEKHHESNSLSSEEEGK